MVINVCIAGATGWVGADLSRAVHAAEGMQVSGAVARAAEGKKLGDVLDVPGLDVVVHSTADRALTAGCDVLVEFSKPDVAKANVLKALQSGAHVVVGTSGLSDEDYEEIDRAARKAGLGVLAAGNFALTAVLLLKFATLAAKYIPQYEVIDYAGAAKPDAPSGTARELAYRLGQVRQSELAVPVGQTIGPKESRGAGLGGCQVHSVRLPGYVASAEVIFGQPEMQLSMRHDAGTGAQPYIDGTLLAIRKVSGLKGLVRGLDRVLE
jgi:4-hydroxy-tetrahydrodipicolinate reductase